MKMLSKSNSSFRTYIIIIVTLLTFVFMQACSSPSMEDEKQFDISSEPTELLLNKVIRDKTVLQ